MTSMTRWGHLPACASAGYARLARSAGVPHAMPDCQSELLDETLPCFRGHWPGKNRRSTTGRSRATRRMFKSGAKAKDHKQQSKVNTLEVRLPRNQYQVSFGKHAVYSPETPSKWHRAELVK